MRTGPVFSHSRYACVERILATRAMREPVMPCRCVWGWCLAVACVACNPSEVRLDALLTEAARHPDRSTAEYRGIEMRVTGTVAEATIKTAHHQRRDKMWTGERVPENRWVEGYGVGYVILLPPEHSKGDLVCWFDLADRDPITQIQMGDVVTVWGVAREFRAARKGGLELVLDECVLDSTPQAAR